MPITSESRRRVASGLIWIIPALWATNYIVARSAAGVVEPYTLAFGRWAIAGGLLAFASRAELWRERRHIASNWFHYLVLGALGMFICGAWVYQGAKTTVAMNMALIYSASPALIALGAVIWLGERFSWRQTAGVLLALAGVIHVIVRGQWLALTQVQWVAGDGWILAATVSWAAFALLQKIWHSSTWSQCPPGHDLSGRCCVAVAVCCVRDVVAPEPSLAPKCRCFGSGGRPVARFGGLLALQLVTKNHWRQSGCRYPLPGAAVCRLGCLVVAGRGFGMAPFDGRWLDFAGCLPGQPAAQD